MRVTVSHNKSKEEVRRAAEQAVDQLLRETPPALMQITDVRKQWDGPLLRFWLTARMAILKNPIQGSIEVTDRDLTVDVDLGMLNALFPEQKVRKTIEDQLRGRVLGPGKTG
jgi:Putative polyhydroxyalkanoic acid system protein (PHA_gran_rgn)